MDLPTLIVVIVATLGSLLILVLYGIVGPPSLRARMKTFLNFFDRDSAIFFPYDHTKPSNEALKEMVENWRPTRQRIKNALRLIAWLLAIPVLAVILALVIILIAGALHSSH